LQELGVKGDERRDLERIFETKTAKQWEEWAAERDLPLAAVRDVERDEEDEGEETAFLPERRRTSTRGENKS
jgi:crotonobetainyl-CoA:carnitine CoA-transferase CaiB-like acyl-CoA transferase